MLTANVNVTSFYRSAHIFRTSIYLSVYIPSMSFLHVWTSLQTLMDNDYTTARPIIIVLVNHYQQQYPSISLACSTRSGVYSDA